MLTDVIAALATPPGRSAVALLRVSGHGTHALAARVLSPYRLDRPRRSGVARARHPVSGETLDEVLYTPFAAPASFTGEDMVEIGTHGGLLVPAEVLAALRAAGARDAAPGEFTRRALANGRLDLLQAEATGDLIDATAPAQRRAALRQLDQGLSRRISELRARVLEIEALVSYDIDFPEEDSGPVPPEQVDRATLGLRAALDALLRTAGEGERLREGAVCVIAGAPNAGKSSLFNALLGADRAIVTEVAGTTRDAIEAPATCGGFPFRLVDTAGLREGGDRVERLGIDVSRRYLRAADLVLLCIEAGRERTTEEQRFLDEVTAPVVEVRTKADRCPDASAGALSVSVVTGDGLDLVRRELARVAFERLSGSADMEPVITRERQRQALARARDEVEAFADARRRDVEAVMAATHLRAAVTALEDVIGLVSADDVLDRLFATFCVGK